MPLFFCAENGRLGACNAAAFGNVHQARRRGCKAPRKAGKRYIFSLANICRKARVHFKASSSRVQAFCKSSVFPSRYDVQTPQGPFLCEIGPFSRQAEARPRSATCDTLPQ